MGLSCRQLAADVDVREPVVFLGLFVLAIGLAAALFVVPPLFALLLLRVHAMAHALNGGELGDA
jgi:hypothetical protein